MEKSIIKKRLIIILILIIAVISTCIYTYKIDKNMSYKEEKNEKTPNNKVIKDKGNNTKKEENKKTQLDKSLDNKTQKNEKTDDKTENSNLEKQNEKLEKENKDNMLYTELEKINELDNTEYDFWYVPNSEHMKPKIDENLNSILNKYDTMYVGDTSRKVLYLTMDEGYENNYTNLILDVLKSNDVKATFFVLSSYIENNPNIVLRMVNEGHAVANHSKSHLSTPSLTNDVNTFKCELQSVEQSFKNLTGEEIKKYYRPPMGKYSEKSLSMTKQLGYKTVFWSFAYNDWEIDNQPTCEYAQNTILNGLHNGSIILLHPVSKTNSQILDKVIKEAKNQGYNFELLP